MRLSQDKPRRLGFQFRPFVSLRPQLQIRTLYCNLNLALPRDRSSNLSSPLSTEFSPRVMPDYFTPLLLAPLYMRRSIRHRSGVRWPPIVTFFSKDLIWLATHSRRSSHRRPTRPRSWTVKRPRNSNNVLLIECLSPKGSSCRHRTSLYHTASTITTRFDGASFSFIAPWSLDASDDRIALPTFRHRISLRFHKRVFSRSRAI